MTGDRIADVLRPALGEIEEVVDTTPADLEVVALLALPEGIRVEATDSGALAVRERLDPTQLLVVAAGPDRERHPDLDNALALLDRLPVGGQALLLLAHDPGALPAADLLDGLGTRAVQIRRLVPLRYRHLSTAALLERVDHGVALLPHLRPSLGEGPRPAHGGTAVRLANEAQLLDFQLRVLRGRTDAPVAPAPRATGVSDPAAQRSEALSADRHRLERVLRRTEAELRAAQRRIDALERSAAYQLGRTLVETAKRPGPDALSLPLRMWRLYQGRARSAGSGGSAAAARPAPELRPGTENRLFVSATTARLLPRRRLSLAGVWRDETRARLAPDCEVSTLLPNDASLVLERVLPSAVLIEAAAARPGHPWAYAGSTPGVERDRDLLDLIAVARSLGMPAVFWANAAPHEAPGLRAVAAACDLVVGEPGVEGATVAFRAGVQLAVHHPIDLDPHRHGVLALARRDPAEPPAERAVVDRLLRAALPDGLTLVEDAAGVADQPWPDDLAAALVPPPRWTATGRLYRSASLGLLPSPPTPGDGAVRVLEQAACGVTIVGRTGSDLAGLLGDALVAIDGTTTPEDALRAARARAPRTSLQTRRLLRSLHPRLTVRGQLASLAAALDLDVAPAAELRVAVLVDARGRGDLGPLVEAALAQQHPPAEVLLAVDDAEALRNGERGLTELRASGIGAQAFVIRAQDRTERVARLAATASSRWATVWDVTPRVHPHTLTDLVLAAECGRPDAVGRSRAGDATFIDDLPLDGALVRTALLTDPDLPLHGTLSGWHRRGLRLLGVHDLADAPHRRS